jgi:AraC-like DNA-binding protein
VSVIDVFRAADVPAPDRIDYWYEIVANKCGTHELGMPEGVDPTEELRLGTAGALRVDELLAARTYRLDRTARHIRRGPNRDRCKLHVVVRGRAAVRQNGREALLAPGDFVLVDDEKPVSKVMTGARFVTVAFPRMLLPLGPDDVRKLSGLRFDGNDGVGGLASSLVCQLVDRLDAWDETEGAQVGATVLDLLTVALATRLDGDPTLPTDRRERALLARVHGFVEEHLGDPSLSPATVAAANHVSVRSLHRLFETRTSTVAAWIRRRRLERCRRDLADPTMRTVPVSTIAARWGLTNATHFGRQFHAAYGVLPTEYRREALDAADGARLATLPTSR